MVSGINDISYNLRDGTFDAEKTADNIVNIGRVCLKHGILVVISGLFARKNTDLNRCTQETNGILRDKCHSEGFEFMEHESIGPEHILSDGLHLNANGTAILKQNILEHLKHHQQQHPKSQPKSQPFPNSIYTPRPASQNSQNLQHSNPLQYVDNNSQIPDVNIPSVPVLRPGRNTYSEAVTGAAGTKTMIISTSMTRDIDTKTFNGNYANGTATFHRFRGGHARHIKNQIATHLSEERPDNVVILIGGNDLQTSRTNPTPVLQIANHILESALICKEYDVRNICVTSVLPREQAYMQLRRKDLNTLLRGLCLLHNFIFIDTDNNIDRDKRIILSKHICGDGVHLNDCGTDLLSQIFLDALNSIQS